jgi:protein-S-isoprenylcysteine O-methyltransferase Ste14
MDVFGYLIFGLWIAWLAIWLLAAGNTKETLRRESGWSRLSYTVPLWIAAYLMIARHIPWEPLNRRIVPDAAWPVIVGAAIVLLGLGFAVWARFYLGRNWSANVTLKRDHELIRTGPYRWVRNPIYTGMIVAIIGSALARGRWAGVLAAFLMTASFWYKARKEEQVLHDAFGAEYDAYRRDVASLIPFVL